MALMEVGLDDKYRLDAKRIFLSGTQALVRLPMLQRERDRAQGLNTAGFISGYRGSPLGMYDHALWRAKAFLKQHDIEFSPGLNEDLAATAVWGSQQVGMFPGAKVDGVFGIWYGKGPGVDRSVDALKHANSAGTSPNGGVIALAGDDHGCQSSTLAASERAGIRRRIDAGGQPGDAAGLSRSRHSAALRCRATRAAGSASRRFRRRSKARPRSSVDPDRIKIVMPDDFEMPPGGLSHPLARCADGAGAAAARPEDAGGRGVRARQPLRPHRARRPKPARLGIMATGKAYLDLRQALADLGITDAEAQALGMRIYKVGADLAAGGIRARGASPKGCRTCWWSRRSAASSRTSSAHSL